MASELKATPVPPEGELELSSEHREKLLDLTVNFLNSCKAVEADDLEGIDKACMKSIDNLISEHGYTIIEFVLKSKDWRGSEELSEQTKRTLGDLEAAAIERSPRSREEIAMLFRDANKRLTSEDQATLKSFFKDNVSEVGAKFRKTITNILAEVHSKTGIELKNGLERVYFGQMTSA